mmetsp:Transcript_3101/g.7434  ORF Transcript_3101/g.7434 Transcript_3101/m.7434 type:complete len:977 (+) Transcript_3101:228-3158(+)|eukprot:CAMPEP_0182927510 /NCGR_PEP_ID=MMETSP0105_2-20130417/13819_1 /TAXON_ID=81532 ORGANISM="Acanthoeca-like sp., Strain 10tr" /NCGR_SAMPLE_ID=MMETSP0105_2 /ASSEMBLY_ACC=CAM_ASM_000205 /LENGTH=976 /DNA_ID=CAMNT_0025065459 /DNA_START=147 /DNA_END=3077 /DNA_ORIENTATION=-
MMDGSDAGAGPHVDPVLYPDEDEMDEMEAPFAANAENKTLHKEVKRMERLLLELEADIEANTARVSAMETHKKNVDHEIKVVQSVNIARDKEVSTDKRMALLAEGETKQLEKSAKNLQKDIETNVGVQNTLQNQIFTVKRDMDGLREQLEWDEQQMKEWLENAKVREEDTEVLRKYQRADEGRVKELTLELDRLNQEAIRKERQLEVEVTNTRSHRLGLDKVSLLFKEAHNQRVDTIAQWEDTVAKMEAEDKAINAAAQKFQDLKAEVTTIKLQVSEEQEFLDQGDTANKEADMALDKQERVVAQLEGAREAAAAQADRFQSELDSLRNVVTRTSHEERRQVREAEAMVETYSNRAKLLDDALAEVDALEAKVEDNTKSAMTAEEQAAELEDQLAQEEAYTREVNRQLTAISERLAAVSQKGHELRSKKAGLESEIHGCAQADKNLTSKLRSVERHMVHQGQLLYKQDFQSAVLERKLLKLEGTTDDGEAEAQTALQAEVDSLKGVLAEHAETQKLLKSQLRRLVEEGRVATKRRDTLATELRTAKQRVADIELYNTGAEKELETVTAAKQNMMVDENLLKLTLRRLRKQLDTRADDVHSLEERKHELKDAMRERMQEIKVHKELLTVQKADVTRERSRVAKELAERNVRIDQLKKRHDIVSFSMKGSVDESGEERSEAYLMVKAAQEREELQQKGDALDAQIRKQDKELRMLDQTLQLMNGHNSKYKSSLKRATGESDDMAMKEHLEGQLRTALDKFKHKRRELHIQQQERENQEIKRREIVAQLGAAKRELGMLDAELLNVQRELDDQDAKFDRAHEQARKIILAFRKEAGNVDTETVAEKDFMLRDTKDFLTRMRGMIDAIIAEVPELRPEISLLYSTNGLEPPRAAGQRAGAGPRSSSSSVTSSRPSSKALSSRGGPSSSRASSRAASSRGGARSSRTKPATAAAAAAQRASVVTPRTMDLGFAIEGRGKSR